MSELTRQQQNEMSELMEKARAKAIAGLQEERTDMVGGEEVKRMVYKCTVGEAQLVGAKAAAKVSQEYKRNIDAIEAEKSMAAQNKKRGEEQKESKEKEEARKKRNVEIREGKDEVEVPGEVEEEVVEETEVNTSTEVMPEVEPEEEPVAEIEEPEVKVKKKPGRKKGGNK